MSPFVGGHFYIYAKYILLIKFFPNSFCLSWGMQRVVFGGAIAPNLSAPSFAPTLSAPISVVLRGALICIRLLNQPYDLSARGKYFSVPSIFSFLLGHLGMYLRR